LEVGWTLRRDFWGRGYATEAAQVALDYAFDRLGQTRVISLIQPDNRASIAVALRLGMRFEGYTEVMGHPVLIYVIDSQSRRLV
jgi:RimJ/RimL family protein N-acetyltransferase